MSDLEPLYLLVAIWRSLPEQKDWYERCRTLKYVRLLDQTSTQGSNFQGNTTAIKTVQVSVDMGYPLSCNLPPDHLLLDRSPNIGPPVSRWELDKFENCWNKSFRTSKILTLLYRQLSNLLIFQQDMSGPRLGTLSNNRGVPRTWKNMSVNSYNPKFYISIAMIGPFHSYAQVVIHFVKQLCALASSGLVMRIHFRIR
jgi:hypothetical protein